MRITLVIASLACGGAERAMAMMADYFAAHGEEVTLITLAAEETDFFKIHAQIKRVALGLLRVSANPWQALQNNRQRLQRLRQSLKSSPPDAVISFMDRTNVLTLMATIGLPIPVIVAEHTDPRQRHIGWFWAGMRRLTYPRASAIVVLSEEARQWAERFVRQAGRVHVIPNPIALPADNSNAVPSHLPGGRLVVSLGRLIPSKGFDRLLRAFAPCAAKHAGWSLVIFGEGDERRNLAMLAAELKIAPRVYLPGLTPNPMASLQRADLFVMSSHYEGFPMALLEAMACGVPVVSFDCPTGPRQIIRNGVDGVLVPPGDLEALAAAMDRLMSDEAERRRLGARAKEVVERFGLERVMEMWAPLLNRRITHAVDNRSLRQK
jgi:glycosyltransferase involved in cell wall biosynthesis